MIEIADVRELVDPVVICAFDGWNDAADAASGAVDHLIDVWNAELVGGMDPEDFYDFQVNRPNIGFNNEGMRTISWPGTSIYIASPAGLDHDVILIRGTEPSMRWRQFANEILVACDELGASMLVSFGALLAGVPHSRPIQVQGYSSEPEIVDRMSFEPSSYEGPTGIVGVLVEACERADLPAVSYWAAVPHYVSSPPCPKATLALINRLEELLEIPIPLGDLPEDSRAWERGVEELAAEDEDVAEYVRGLEEEIDTSELPEASGEAIAREFEKYLKRRGDSR